MLLPYLKQEEVPFVATDAYEFDMFFDAVKNDHLHAVEVMFGFKNHLNYKLGGVFACNYIQSIEMIGKFEKYSHLLSDSHN